jgi:hypothetical protein
VGDFYVCWVAPRLFPYATCSACEVNPKTADVHLSVTRCRCP